MIYIFDVRLVPNAGGASVALSLGAARLLVQGVGVVADWRRRDDAVRRGRAGVETRLGVGVAGRVAECGGHDEQTCTYFSKKKKTNLFKIPNIRILNTNKTNNLLYFVGTKYENNSSNENRNNSLLFFCSVS